VALTILEGSTFCICDVRGDVEAETNGFFADDTRHLSLFRLTLNGEKPLLLSSGKVEYFSAAFYLRNSLAGDLPQDSLSIVRTRFVGEGMQDRIMVRNESMEPRSFAVGIEIGSDFADIFAVKSHDFSLGNPLHPHPLPPLRDGTWNDGRCFLADEGEAPARTVVVFSHPGRHDGRQSVYDVELDPRQEWELVVDVFPSRNGTLPEPKTAERHFGDEVSRVRDSLAAWQLRIPQIKASWDSLGHAFNQSVADLASLRMRGRQGRVGKLPAAGMPWFMTVFGRDTVITCLQTLVFGPELARTALEVLAELQSTVDDPSIDAEPGKIVHEVRHGKAARNWFHRYYGTVDATPLYLVLLHEVWRWTDDALLVRELREPARRALDWIDQYGDRDGDGFVEYQKRSPKGLDNQSWKDSFDSQRFHDGRVAEPPIAPCEVQGYVYDAKRRMAELARVVWRDRKLADRLDAEADELRARFNESFWIEDDEGGFYALALDGDKQPVDSLTSNVGHLLWSGIVPDERAELLVDQLMGEHLWSGWGVRTMSARDAAYNPLSYHNGTVWPHDNSIIAWGLARYGRWTECYRVVRRMLDAVGHFGWQLPEVFAGMPRSETPFPIAYPTAARPQAWAAGTPVLLLQLLLGLEPNRERQALETIAPDVIPSWAGDVRLSSVRAFDRSWDVHLVGGRVRIERS
jgi:glycogen debranching enzyme